MKPHHSLILFLLLLAGCSSNSNLTSFGNRKYTKGYFWNNPTAKPDVDADIKAEIGNNGKKNESRKSQSLPENKEAVIYKTEVKQSVALKQQSISLSTNKAAEAQLINKPKVENPTIETSDLVTSGDQTNYGGEAIGFAIAGAILGLLCCILVLLVFLISAVASAGISLTYMYLLIIPLVILLTALVLGIMGEKSKNEKNESDAMAGIVISSIMLGLLLVVFFALLPK